MNKKLHISDIANLFGVPVSTLRYWERQGLITFDRDTDNQYRYATVMTIRNLCDITFYRKLSVPVGQLKVLYEKDYMEIKDILLKSKIDLEKKKLEITRVLESIDIKLDQIETVKERKDTIQFVMEALPGVRYFDLYNKSDLKNLLIFERDLIVMIPYQHMERYRYGVFVPDAYPKEKLIRQKDESPRLYLKILMQSSYDQIEQNNLKYYHDYLLDYGYKPGLALGKVLVSSNDEHEPGHLHNYYETWIEAIPME